MDSDALGGSYGGARLRAAAQQVSEEVELLAPTERAHVSYVLDELRSLSDAELLAVLRSVPDQTSAGAITLDYWWGEPRDTGTLGYIERLSSFIIPTGTPRNVHCQLPNNAHNVTASKGYVCRTNPSHEFCKAHSLSSCPLCGGGLTLQ